MKLRYIFIFVLLAACGLTACERDEPEMKATAALPLAGEWWVTYKLETSPGQFEDQGGGYTKILTYNTASNRTDSIWVTDVTGDGTRDHGNFWTFRVKSGADMANRTFSVTGNKSIATFDYDPYDINITITEGKVIPNGGLSASGVKTDSIYFKMQFEDDPDNTYIVSGHKRTGFLEDDF